MGIQISLETWLPFWGLSYSFLVDRTCCRYEVLLMVVDLHYLVMVVPNHGLPSPTSLPAPWGGTHFLNCALANSSILGVCLPLWGCPGPSPLTGGGPCRVLGPRALGVVRRGFLPFLPEGGRVCSPDPGPGLVARPPPLFSASCLMPCWPSSGTCLSLFPFPWGGGTSFLLLLLYW